MCRIVSGRRRIRAWILLYMLLAVSRPTSPAASQSPKSHRLPRAASVVFRVRALEIDSALVQISALDVAGDGRIYLLSSASRAVFVLDSRGRPKPGTGVFAAGSYQAGAPTAMGIVGDTLWIADHFRRRIELISTDGVVLGERVYAMEGEAWLSPRSDIFIVPRIVPNVYTSTSHKLEVFKASAPGEKPTEVFTAPSSFHVFAVSVGMQQALARQPFEDGPLWNFMRDGSGIVYIDRTTASVPDPKFRVLRISPTGRTTAETWTRYRAMPLDSTVIARQVDELTARILRSRRDAGIPATLLKRRIREALYIPAHSPTVTAVFGDQDGRLWMRREASAFPDVRWTVLDAAGNGALELLLPPSFQILWAKGRIFIGSELDASGMLNLTERRLP